ncbi:MAG TPA: hypothetical protein VFY84_04780 [Jiangellales bacterium]|nr:hypothetical protein [Jiangellales bacterium]
MSDAGECPFLDGHVGVLWQTWVLSVDSWPSHSAITEMSTPARKLVVASV